LSGIASRVRKIAKVGRKYAMEGDLASAVELNALSLDNVEEFEDLMRHPAFKFFIERLRIDMKNKQKRLNDLAIDPETNKYEICFYRASFEQIKNQISFFDSIVSKGPLLKQERNRLQEAVSTNI